MNPERPRLALAVNEVPYGTLVKTTSQEVVERLGWSGWDFPSSTASIHRGLQYEP
jgi:hypothetical protein